MARIVNARGDGPETAEDYERVLAPLYAWIHAIAQRGGPEVGQSSHGASARAWTVLAGDDRPRDWRRRALMFAFPLLIWALNRARLGPLEADISGQQLRRAALAAFGEVVRRLEVDASYVIFGHTHRAGPLPSDEPSEWRAPAAAELINSGCWVHEPGFLGPRPAESPYRPGFAVTVRDAGPPELRCLLD
jgi:hypothetical protein